MSRITEELRKWASIEVPYKYGHQLSAIADRIDDGCEAMLADARKKAYEGYIELPKDADGEYIRVGDVIEWRYEDDVYVYKVEELVLSDRWDFKFSDEDGKCAGDTTYEASLSDFYENTRHHHAPTVEDVLYESLKHFGAVGERTPEVEEWLHEQAARLQLREDA